MDFQLLAIVGKFIVILVVLLTIVMVQLAGVGLLSFQHIRYTRERRTKRKKQPQNPMAQQPAEEAAPLPAEEGENLSAQDETVALPAEESVSEAAEVACDEPADAAHGDAEDQAEEPLGSEATENAPIAEAEEQASEADFTPEQVEAMLDEFDDEFVPLTAQPQEEEQPAEPTDLDEEAAAFAEQVEQLAASLALQAEEPEPEEQPDEPQEEQPLQTEGELAAEDGTAADDTTEQAEAPAEPDYIESTAETVEEILEEHGLTSGDEITEEIAQEIMAVHTARDNDAVEVVAVDGLYKKYSKKADWAVANVNFHCYEGEIVGLLGHNGAGKSTTIKCLEGMLPFEQGSISICGHDIVKDPIAAKQGMGFVTDNHAVFLKMTGMQYLSFMADVYSVPTGVRKQRIEQLEEVFQLGEAVNNLISSYSHGMRQKICMMGSLIHWPKLWVMDEPMTGLDPRTMHAVQQFMRSYADDGHCIIFSSHALITVAKMCDRVVLLRTGCQLDELNIKRIMTVDPTFDFEEYFLKHEGQD